MAIGNPFGTNRSDLTSYLCPKSLVFALPSAPPGLTFTLLLGSSPFQTIQLARTLLSCTGLAATNFADEFRE